jgi:hypothetical protein
MSPVPILDHSSHPSPSFKVLSSLHIIFGISGFLGLRDGTRLIRKDGGNERRKTENKGKVRKDH